MSYLDEDDARLGAEWEALRLPEDELRRILRNAMRDCPACIPDDADGVEASGLVSWLVSHGCATDGTMPDGSNARV
jgi:hypothetical protein